ITASIAASSIACLRASLSRCSIQWPIRRPRLVSVASRSVSGVSAAAVRNSSAPPPASGNANADRRPASSASVRRGEVSSAPTAAGGKGEGGPGPRLERERGGGKVLVGLDVGDPGRLSRLLHAAGQAFAEAEHEALRGGGERRPLRGGPRGHAGDRARLRQP